MQNNTERAKDLLPTIILTVLSMIQALALELFWSRIEESSFLWEPGPHAIVGWLQLLVMLAGILLIWVFYVSFVLRFTWLPSLEDTLLPFLVGLLEFAMIDLVRPGLLAAWFVLLAAVFAAATFGSYLTLRLAREDPANDYFFSQLEPARWRDYKGAIVTVSLLLSFALVLWLSDHSFWLSILALLLALAAIMRQFMVVKHYWMHSLPTATAVSADPDRP